MPDTYSTIADIAAAARFSERIAACAAQQGVDDDPWTWAYRHRYEAASAPDWAAAVDSWMAANPGQDTGWEDDQAVISDGQILSRVQQLLALP